MNKKARTEDMEMEETKEMEMEETKKTKMEEMDTEMGSWTMLWTWWNSHKRTIGVEAAICLKLGNDLTAYTQRFQELILLCTRMVPNEEDRVERFIGGLPNNIQGNVIAMNPPEHQIANALLNQLMDKKSRVMQPCRA
ncbi:hypothetical protein Tco_0575890 [Tanacetum coccineum]